MGMESMVVRRAGLEDDLATLGRVESLDMAELLGCESPAELKFVVRVLAGLATGRLQVMREMRELDDRLGLTPKGMAQLRWKIVADTPAKRAPKGDGTVVGINDRRDRLSDAS